MERYTEYYGHLFFVAGMKTNISIASPQGMEAPGPPSQTENLSKENISFFLLQVPILSNFILNMLWYHKVRLPFVWGRQREDHPAEEVREDHKVLGVGRKLEGGKLTRTDLVQRPAALPRWRQNFFEKEKSTSHGPDRQCWRWIPPWRELWLESNGSHPE